MQRALDLKSVFEVIYHIHIYLKWIYEQRPQRPNDQIGNNGSRGVNHMITAFCSKYLISCIDLAPTACRQHLSALVQDTLCPHFSNSTEKTQLSTKRLMRQLIQLYFTRFCTTPTAQTSTQG